MVHKNSDNTGASDKAIKKEVEAKGLGVPSSTGVEHDTSVFKETPVRNDDLDKVPKEVSDADSVTRASSKVGPGASIEVTRDAFTKVVPPETTV